MARQGCIGSKQAQDRVPPGRRRRPGRPRAGPRCYGLAAAWSSILSAANGILAVLGTAGAPFFQVDPPNTAATTTLASSAYTAAAPPAAGDERLIYNSAADSQFLGFQIQGGAINASSLFNRRLDRITFWLNIVHGGRLPTGVRSVRILRPQRCDRRPQGDVARQGHYGHLAGQRPAVGRRQPQGSRVRFGDGLGGIRAGVGRGPSVEGRRPRRC